MMSTHTQAHSNHTAYHTHAYMTSKSSSSMHPTTVPMMTHHAMIELIHLSIHLHLLGFKLVMPGCPVLIKFALVLSDSDDLQTAVLFQPRLTRILFLKDETNLVLTFAVIAEVQVLLWQLDIVQVMVCFLFRVPLAQLELYLKWTGAVVRLEDKKHDVAFFLNLVHTVELLVSTLLILEHLVYGLTTLIINSKHVMVHVVSNIIIFVIVVVLDELSWVHDLVFVYVAVFNFVA